jgi:hypothetical protein
MQMPADYCLLLADASEPVSMDAKVGTEAQPAQPGWKDNRDGSKTMRVTSAEQLYAVLPRNPNLKSD